MVQENPILCYFHHQGSPEERVSKKLEQLVNRSEVIFMGLTSPSLKEVSELEDDFNNYSQRGVCSKKLGMLLERKQEFNQDIMLLNATKRTKKRYLFERSLVPNFSFDKADMRIGKAFLQQGFDTAIKYKENFLRTSQKYEKDREERIGNTVFHIPETTLVILGRVNAPLYDKIAQERHAEKHFPYDEYVNPFSIQCMIKFRETRKVDPELYAKEELEGIAKTAIHREYLGAISKKPGVPKRELDWISHEYATLFDKDQILGLRESINLSIKMGIKPHDVFASYLKRISLPSMDDMRQRYIDEVSEE